MANRYFNQFLFSLHKMLVEIDCNFVVDSTNGNGLGIRSLKGPGVQNVYMATTASFTGNTHTSTLVDGISGGTASLVVGMLVSGSGIIPGTVIASIVSSTSITLSLTTTTSVPGDVISYQAVGSPNPAAGLIYVQFQDNYFRYYFGTAGFVSPLSGTPISISTGASLTVGNVYTIVSVGTTTTAQWVAVGLPIGIVPAVGVSFIANATSGAGTGVVETSINSGITSIEVVGDPNQSLTSSVAPGGSVTPTLVSSGPYIVLQAIASGTRTAPANGSVVGLSFFLSNSSVIVQGE